MSDESRDVRMKITIAATSLQGYCGLLPWLGELALAPAHGLSVDRFFCEHARIPCCWLILDYTGNDFLAHTQVSVFRQRGLSRQALNVIDNRCSDRAS
jgi:hypothetical protein